MLLGKIFILFPQKNINKKNMKFLNFTLYPPPMYALNIASVSNDTRFAYKTFVSLCTVERQQKSRHAFLRSCFFGCPCQARKECSDEIASTLYSTHMRVELASVSDDTRFAYKTFVSLCTVERQQKSRHAFLRSCFFGCPCQARTDDTRINSPLLYRLS